MVKISSPFHHVDVENTLQALKIFFGRLRRDLSNNWGGYVLFNAVGPNDENAVGMVFFFYSRTQ